MYPVTTEFQNKIKETTRTFKTNIEIQHSSGILQLTDEDILAGSLTVNESSHTGDDFRPGGVVASTLEFTIVNKTDSINGTFLVDSLNILVDDMLRSVDWYEEYSGINFEGATVIPQVALLLSEAPEIWEYVPLGRFNIDEITKTRNAIKIKAIDNMIELDKPYSLSNLSYPANLYQIYTNICTVADIQPGTTSFINQDYIVDERPEGDYTLRDVLSFVAELSGTFARFNRNGALELVWYMDSGVTLTAANRFNFKPREDLIRISGISKTVTDENGEDITYLAGSDEYVVDLSDNPLLQNNYESVISNIYNSVKDTVFTPFESRWQGNPALQPGDKITQVDRDGNEVSTLITHSTYKYRGASTLAARGMPVKAKRYSGSTNRKIAEIKRKVEKDIGDKLTSLEQAQLNVTELIANMLGGYVIKTDDAIYIADNPDIEQAMKVWKWGIGGFGYSENGVEGPYTTGISADGTIVAMLVAANIITADMVKTGILSSEDDSTWINLNDGTFNFKNLLSYIDGKLEVNSPEIIRSDVSYKGATIGLDYGIYVDFRDGGHAQIGDGSILVQHTDGSHTKIDGRGVMRQFSIPIFEQFPSGTDIVETFESGNIADTRVDLESSWYAIYSDFLPAIPIHDVADNILVTTNAKYSGSYGLELICPKATSGSTRGLECYFINYRPTKDTMLTLKYKTNLSSSSSARLHIKDVDTPGSSTQSVPLNSSVWAEASYFLQENTTYKISIYIHNTSSSVGTVYIDDVVFEENVNEPVIVGYEPSLQPYYDFTYIRKGHFDANGTQQIVLPDYFKGMNFDVFIMPTGNWEWYSTSLDAGEPRIQVDSINNMVPSFTCTYFRYPQKAVDFIYTVVLNN